MAWYIKFNESMKINNIKFEPKSGIDCQNTGTKML